MNLEDRLIEMANTMHGWEDSLFAGQDDTGPCPCWKCPQHCDSEQFCVDLYDTLVRMGYATQGEMAYLVKTAV